MTQPYSALRTWIEISRSAFSTHIRYLESTIPDAHIALVVKSNAYGHGLELITQLAGQHARISMLCTAGIQEALAVRAAGWSGDILVMSYLDAPLESCREHNLQIVLYDLSQARDLAEYARIHHVPLQVHLKVDTGMSRLGIIDTELAELITYIRDQPYIQIVGLMTHLSDTSGTDRDYTRAQLAKLNQIIAQLKDQLLPPLMVHALASGSLDESAHYDMVRVGSYIYGNHKTPELLCRLQQALPVCQLSQIMTWKTRCIQVKKIPTGAYIGYNRSHQASRDMVLGVIPVGYADGYPRALSNQGMVQLGSYYCYVIGMVSMSLLTIDLTDVPSENWHHDVILTGPTPGVTLHDLAKNSGMLVNNITTSIPAHIPRLLI